MAAGGSNGSGSLRIPEDNPDFVDLPNFDTCCVCKQVLRNAFQLQCGHHLCETCIPMLFSSNDTAPCPSGDDECGILNRSEVFRDAYKRKEVMNLEVYCNYKSYGCGEKTRWKSLAKHLATCDYRPLPCPNEGCDYAAPAKDLQHHIDNTCQYIIVNCPHCGQQMQKLHLEEHTKECPQVIESCPYKCGVQDMPRIAMKEHIDVCPKQPKKCPYHVIDCQFQGTDEEVKKHVSKSSNEHLQLVLPFAENMDQLNRQTRSECEAMKLERDDMIKLVDELKNDIAMLKKENKAQRLTINDLKIKIVAQTEKILNIEELIPEYSKKDVVSRLERDLRTIKEQQENFTGKVTRLEQIGFPGGIPVSNTETSNRSLAGQIGDLVQQLKNHDRQIAIQDIRMAELDLKFQILETANYDGTLMWKIRDYSRRKQEAISGRTLSLYSQPFYTSRFGYKMCARVYLNGDGMGKGTHLSLFFVVMQGEYDALLPWPFQQKVTLKLLDQETGGRQSIEDSFQPDPTSSSYRKPATEMNVATGCPLFVSHSVLETRKYVKDDTIFIKIEVDPCVRNNSATTANVASR